MRTTSWLVPALCLAAAYAASYAYAEPPAATSASSASTSVSVSVSAAAAASTSASSSSSSAELSDQDKEKALITRGYKVKTRNGERVMCRRETVLGSRFEKEICATADSLYTRLVSDQEQVSTMQRNQVMYTPK